MKTAGPLRTGLQPGGCAAGPVARRITAVKRPSDLIVLAVLLFLAGHALRRAVEQSPSEGWRAIRFAQASKPTTNRAAPTRPDGALEYRFTNFNGDEVALYGRIRSADVRASVAEFGITQKDLADFDAEYQHTRRQAVAEANAALETGTVEAATEAELERKLRAIDKHNDAIEAELDVTLAKIDADATRKRVELYAAKGLTVRGKKYYADIPLMVKRNTRRVRSYAKALSVHGKNQGYSRRDLVGAVTSMAQTAIRYQVPPAISADGRDTAGVLTPPESLSMGWGDCDSKTAVAAAILANWEDVRMLGVGIPNHYLMAVQQVPVSGEIYIEHGGLPYVLIETAGPAWLPPGKVSAETKAYLKTHTGLRLDRLN